jgi:hypothetical protein
MHDAASASESGQQKAINALNALSKTIPADPTDERGGTPRERAGEEKFRETATRRAEQRRREKSSDGD